MKNQTDFFGIGNAIEAILRMYSTSSRASGRTTSLINNVRKGDRIIFRNNRDADHVRRILQQRKIKGVKCIVIDIKRPGKIFEYGTSQGRTIFDHMWIEEYYMMVIQGAKEDIRFWETESSGCGEAHEQTKLKAKELMKWEDI